MLPAGRTVLLCGVRPEVAGPMASLHFDNWLPEGSVFLEEEELYSSTIKAVRRAYELLKSNSCDHCGSQEAAAVSDPLYYLV